jgi:hypothetical protein
VALEIPFEGFKVDSGRAEAIADACDAVLKQAALAQPSTADQLAGLGIAVALVILRSKVQRSPEDVTARLAAYIVAQVRAIAASRPASPPGG